VPWCSQFYKEEYSQVFLQANCFHDLRFKKLENQPIKLVLHCEKYGGSLLIKSKEEDRKVCFFFMNNS